jgi:hypothetical protein
VALPELILFSRPGCHLCDDARQLIEQLLAQRAADGRPNPAFVERDITTNDDWERAHFATIPVVQLGARQLDLVTSVARLRALLNTLDEPAPARA